MKKLTNGHKEELSSIKQHWNDSEVGRFLVVGGTSVFIDFLCYSTLLILGFNIHFSKGISFSLGTVFAFFANRNYTFNNSKAGFNKFIVFVLLYLSTLLVNVLSNEIVLDLTGRIGASFVIAFLFATVLSASLNFIGMKYIVFNSKDRLL